MDNNIKLPAMNWTKSSIICNMIFLFIIWVTVHIAYLPLEILQSSINNEIGIYSMVTLSGGKLLSSFLGPLIVYKLTPKWTVFISVIAVLIYVGANFIPRYYILIPASILVGFTQGPMWIAFGVYCTAMSLQYSAVTGQYKDKVLNRFNAYMTAAVPIAIMVGNFISSTVLSGVYSSPSSHCDKNYTVTGDCGKENLTITDDHEDRCGLEYCPVQDDLNNITSDQDAKLLVDFKAFYILLGIFGIFTVCSLLLTVAGLKNLSENQYKVKQKGK